MGNRENYSRYDYGHTANQQRAAHRPRLPQLPSLRIGDTGRPWYSRKAKGRQSQPISPWLPTTAMCQNRSPHPLVLVMAMLSPLFLCHSAALFWLPSPYGRGAGVRSGEAVRRQAVSDTACPASTSRVSRPHCNTIRASPKQAIKTGTDVPTDCVRPSENVVCGWM